MTRIEPGERQTVRRGWRGLTTTSDGPVKAAADGPLSKTFAVATTIRLGSRLAGSKPARRRQSDEEKCKIGNNHRQQKQQVVRCPIAVEATEQIRSKPSQTYDDVAEDAHNENAASAAASKPMGEQKAGQPDDYAKPADLFCIPRPVPPPFGLSPNHAKGYSGSGQTRRNAAEYESDARKGTHPRR